MNYAYLRVSSDSQDVENQKLGILEYANRKGIEKIQFIEDSASGALSWKDRKMGQIISNAQSGDVVLVSEVSRLARSTLQVLELMEAAARSQISIHITKSGLQMDGSLQSTITATVLGLAAQIERELISQRTKEALKKRKLDGVILGRPRGPAKKLKLDDRKEEIVMYLKKGVSKASIAKLLDCSRSNLYYWLDRRKKTLKL